MAPNSLPKPKNTNLKFNNYPHLESTDEGCPKGQVPIQRLKVDNLTDVIHPLTETAPGKHDKATGHWWVIHLGYWPEKLFTEFGGGANSVQFGGWTYGYPDGMSPPMGTGYFPTTNNLKQSGFFLNLKYVDDLGVLQDAHRLRQVADISNCYDAIYLGHKNRVNEQILTFGGPGGQCDL
ncbi:hypothetical protein Patl1_03553 [Pistacia atlantica]|uniref:Uncharacterized protein n=1 Tax=Pistacia atlantica TaxID=434234 RepID=A0ACC1C986_9ROSI|nr:hypothetical protein Patl1_03553 [Pistacia atlantica]